MRTKPAKGGHFAPGAISNVLNKVRASGQVDGVCHRARVPAALEQCVLRATARLCAGCAAIPFSDPCLVGANPTRGNAARR